MPDYQVFELGDVALQSGLTLRAARLAYKTYGSLNARKDNVIVFPTFFSSHHEANEPMIRPGMAFDGTGAVQAGHHNEGLIYRRHFGPRQMEHTNEKGGGHLEVTPDVKIFWVDVNIP